ncbi:MAG: hypothetical protein LUG50_02000 [Planctomycetaceae bacterium]|nr:hypothetical protein [Planctomycetaceae bacterium]
MTFRKPSRPRWRAVLLPLVLLALGAASGCSMGFVSLHPGENSALYQPLFTDIISNYDEPYWLWVRGTITGDLNGNGIVDEEIVLATIQKGDERNPGPIEIAILAACTVNADGTRTAIARQLLFDRSPIGRAPKPVNDLGIVRDAPFTRCRAQMVSDKTTLTETVVVYFWSDPTPSSVWYAGFALEDGKLVKNLETVMWQGTPGFLTANLDRSIDASPYGYQLVFGVSAIPDEIFRKIGLPSESPLWGHVYARNEHGYYVQADKRFANNYRQLQGPWNQAYLNASLKGLPPEELAWFEYHLGILNHYTGDAGLSQAFLQRARRNAADPVLQKAVDEAFVFATGDISGSPEQPEVVGD